MKVNATVRLLAFHDGQADIELEVPDGVLGSREPVTLDDDDLAERWRCSRKTLRRMRQAGRLPHHRVGRRYAYKLDDIIQIEATAGADPSTRSVAKRARR